MTSASAALPQQPGRTKAFLRLVMIEHSVFALLFAYHRRPDRDAQWDENIHWGRLLLVTVAMVGLRTSAMAVNRIIDREIDACNLRTAHRELVTGAMSVKHAWTGALIALVVFLGAAACSTRSAWPSPPIAVIPMVVYPYGKRFTNFPQAILGLAQAMGRSAGGWRSPASGPGGRDPRPRGRHLDRRLRPDLRLPGRRDRPAGRRESVPARFGVPAAIWGARACPHRHHGPFVWYAVATDAGVLFWLGLADRRAGAFGYEHTIVRPTDLTRLNRAFFSVNGFIGIALFVCALLDLLVRGLTVRKP